MQKIDALYAIAVDSLNRTISIGGIYNETNFT